MYQSEGYVWPAFVALAKNVTRRQWKPQTASQFGWTEAGIAAYRAYEQREAEPVAAGQLF